MVNKISIVGAGRVGESTAQMLAIQKLAQQIVLIDLDEQYAKGVALDIQETSPVYHSILKIPILLLSLPACPENPAWIELTYWPLILK